MKDWIPFGDGSYLIEQAFLVNEDHTAALLEEAVLEVYTGRGAKRQMKGSGRIRNIHMVELLEEKDDLDLILDLGGEFKYRLPVPNITAGKVFAPDVKSTLQFYPVAPWHQIPEPEFEELLGQLDILK